MSQKSDKNNYIKSSCIIFVSKCSNILKLYTLKAFFSKNQLDKQKLHHLLGYHAIGINTSLIFFKCFAFFKFTMPSQ